MKMHELADQAGATFIQNQYLLSLAGLERLVAKVKAETKEACAKVCDARYMGDNTREDMEARRCAADIRASRIP